MGCHTLHGVSQATVPAHTTIPRQLGWRDWLAIVLGIDFANSLAPFVRTAVRLDDDGTPSQQCQQPTAHCLQSLPRGFSGNQIFTMCIFSEGCATKSHRDSVKCSMPAGKKSPPPSSAKRNSRIHQDLQTHKSYPTPLTAVRHKKGTESVPVWKLSKVNRSYSK